MLFVTGRTGQGGELIVLKVEIDIQEVIPIRQEIQEPWETRQGWHRGFPARPHRVEHLVQAVELHPNRPSDHLHEGRADGEEVRVDATEVILAEHQINTSMGGSPLLQGTLDGAREFNSPLRCHALIIGGDVG